MESQLAKFATVLRGAADLASDLRNIAKLGSSTEEMLSDICIELHNLARRIESHVETSKTTRK